MLTFRIDDLTVTGPVTFVKIDVEGHEVAVLRGMTKLILGDRPAFVIESSSREADEILRPLEYT